MASQTVAPRRFSLEDVEAMVAAGILSPEARLELIDGVLFEMSPSGPQHGGAVEWLTKHFVLAARGAYRVRVRDTFLIDDGSGFVVPDLMAIESLPRDQLPDSALLVVEVAYSSHAQGVDLRARRRAGVLDRGRRRRRGTCASRAARRQLRAHHAPRARRRHRAAARRASGRRRSAARNCAALSALECAEATSEKRRQERDRLVGAALDDHWTQARVARALGLTRARVGQLVARIRRTPDATAQAH
ncbi:MAG: Uma2 family endonuclease [Solirubrobacteraceae bacterium]|nr:Uma2 family endonuclease [Solirubrobacteraceae bacterium]